MRNLARMSPLTIRFQVLNSNILQFVNLITAFRNGDYSLRQEIVDSQRFEKVQSTQGGKI